MSSKLSDLTATTTLASADLFYTAISPFAPGDDRKITKADLITTLGIAPAWATFVPVLSSTMTLSGITIQHARILTIGNLIMLSGSFNLTTSGVASPSISLTVPGVTFTATNQNATGFVSGGFGDSVGNIVAIGGGNSIECSGSDMSNFTLGSTGISFNVFFEIV